MATAADPIATSREAAGREIEEAGNALHRAQALLTQLKVVGMEESSVGPALSEASHAYEQGLGCLRINSFVTAGEFAAASRELSRAVAIVLLRALRCGTAGDLHAPRNGNHRPAISGTRPSEMVFSSAERRLARIRWLLDNGTLPAEVIKPVRTIAAWSEQLFRGAQRSFRNASGEDALELAQAAEAAAHSAEHFCKMCYLKEG